MSQWKKRLMACVIAVVALLAVPTAVLAVQTLLEPDPPAPVGETTISTVQISADAPEAGRVPTSITADGDDYVIDSFQWLEGDEEIVGAFEAGKQYSLKVLLKANNYAKFEALTPIVSGAVSVSAGTLSDQNVGNTLTFTAVFPKLEAAPVPSTEPKAYLSYKNGEVFLVDQFSDSENVIYNLGRKGPNSIFDFKRVDFVSIGLNGEKALTANSSWNLYMNGTDFFGPYEINVAAEPSKTAPFTGGNHGYMNSGDPNDPANTPTGRTASLKVYADGQEVSEGFTGYADTVTFKWVNMVQAANTVKADGSGREVLKEEYEMVYDGEKFNIHNTITFLEDSYVTTYYGLMMWTGWAKSGIKYVDAANTQWNSYIGDHNSGGRECSAAIFKRDGYHCKMSLDTTFGIGQKQYLPNTSAYPGCFQYDYGGYGNGKTYFNLLRDGSVKFVAGQVLEFKGGFHYYYSE